MKPLDKINVPVTALVGVGVILLSIVQNPQAQSAIVDIVTHPTVQATVGAIGTLAGVVLLYIAKPVGTSDAPKGPNA